MPGDTDIRAAMLRAGVHYPPDPPPATASETTAADALGLTTEELRFARRLGVEPELYAASKKIHSLATFEAEILRRRSEKNTG